MPSEPPELFSPEVQSFFTDAITSARLRVSFAQSKLTSAQRELDDARDSLLTLETRRKRLGVPDITPNTDDMELPDDVSLLSEDHAHSVGSRSTMFIGLIGGVTDDDKSSGFSFKNYTSKLFAVSSARTASTAPTEHTQDDNEDARSRASARSTAAAVLFEKYSLQQ